MKKLLSLIVVFILSYILLAVALVQGWQTVKVVALTFAVAVTLAILLEVIKLIGFFISGALSSILYCLVALVLTGTLAYYGEIPAVAGFASGVVFSVALFLLTFRKVARVAQKSVIFGEIFSFISAYTIRNYIDNDRLADKQDSITLNLDIKNTIAVLRSVGFKASEAKEAAESTLELPSQTPLEDRVQVALKSLDKRREVYSKN